MSEIKLKVIERAESIHDLTLDPQPTRHRASTSMYSLTFRVMLP